MQNWVNVQVIKNLYENVNQDNIGDYLEIALMIQSLIINPFAGIKSEEYLDQIKKYAGQSDIGWRNFQEPILPIIQLSQLNIWQIYSIISSLQELSYCFERIEEAALLTWDRSAPVRFYVNGIFHYISSLFLLGWKDNEEQGLPYPGTVIKVLHPLGLSQLLSNVYEILNRKFGDQYSYGDTIRLIRNRHFVHGKFSPNDIAKVVQDGEIYDELQSTKFANYHREISNQIVLLKLRLISIVSILNIDVNIDLIKKIYGINDHV